MDDEELQNTMNKMSYEAVEELAKKLSKAKAELTTANQRVDEMFEDKTKWRNLCNDNTEGRLKAEAELTTANERNKELRGTLGAIIKQLNRMQSKEYSHEIFKILTTSYSKEMIDKLLKGE